MTRPQKPKSLAKRLNAVMKEFSYLQKDATIKTKGGSYEVVTHDAVTALLRPHLVKHGIIVLPAMTSLDMLENNRAMVQMLVTFMNVDDREDYISVESCAISDDYGDKGPGKACSYAVKYAYLKVFMIETGEEEEGRIVQPDVPMSASQLQKLLDLMRETATDEDQFLEYFRNKHATAADALANIPKAKFSMALAALQSKKAQQEKPDEPPATQ